LGLGNGRHVLIADPLYNSSPIVSAVGLLVLAGIVYGAFGAAVLLPRTAIARWLLD
jgi:hypothetical protein